MKNYEKYTFINCEVKKKNYMKFVCLENVPNITCHITISIADKGIKANQDSIWTFALLISMSWGVSQDINGSSKSAC